MRLVTGKADEMNMGLDSSPLSLPNATPGLVLIPSAVRSQTTRVLVRVLVQYVVGLCNILNPSPKGMGTAAQARMTDHSIRRTTE